MTSLIGALRPFLLPLSLIVGLSALLLGMDKSDSRTEGAKVRLAVVVPASTAVIDESLKAVLQTLEMRGIKDGETARIKVYNAQGDAPTANDIARQVTNGSVDLIISLATLSLQSVANANRQTQVKHVFGVVTDAASAGVGVSATDPLGHPAWMTGYTSLVPVRPLLDLAREFNPSLRKIGLVWHSAEVSSQVYTLDARKTVKEMGMELIEANADTPTEVGPAAQSLISRQVDALLVTGDVTVLTAVDQVVKAARSGGIPVITLIPGSFRKGALLDLGTDYRAVGADVADLAVQIIQGAKIPTLPVLNKVPPALYINLTALDGLRGSWSVPPDVLKQAQRVIDKDGERSLR